MNKTNRRQKGFTLIELLIVIVIIGILAGVILAVINPAEQRKKASEGVLRANTDKLCTALHACGATTTTTASCDTFTEVGANNPTGTPTGSTYTMSAVGAVVTVAGTANGCTVTCTYNTTTSVSTGPTLSGTCVTL